MSRIAVSFRKHKRVVAAAVTVAVVGVGLGLGLSSTAFAAVPAHAPIQLGSAGSFAILSKTGVTDVPSSAVTGDVGASPITGAAILLTCPEVTGNIYSVNAAGPPCAITDANKLTTAVGDMGTAYTDAAGRQNPDHVDLGAGEIGGRTLSPGLYKWNTGVSITSDVTLSGTPDSVFIFQISGTLTQASAVRVTLEGGVLAKNIFWQTTGAVTLDTTAHMEGVVMSKSMIAMKTNASINGRLLAQTAVTLQINTVTEPAESGPLPLPLPTD